MKITIGALGNNNKMSYNIFFALVFIMVTESKQLFIHFGDEILIQSVASAGCVDMIMS